MKHDRLAIGLGLFGTGLVLGMLTALVFAAILIHGIYAPGSTALPVFLLIACCSFIGFGAINIAYAFPEANAEVSAKSEATTNGLPSTPSH